MIGKPVGGDVDAPVSARRRFSRADSGETRDVESGLRLRIAHLRGDGTGKSPWRDEAR